MVKWLVAFGWLRDMAIVFLLLAANRVRYTSRAVGLAIILSTLVVFLERFLWSWHLSDLKDMAREAD